MNEITRIDPDAWYQDADLAIRFGFRATTLAHGRRRGGLRFARKGRSTLYRGQWLLDWLERDTVPTDRRRSSHESVDGVVNNA